MYQARGCVVQLDQPLLIATGMAIFDLAGQTVMLEAADSSVLADGDDIIVAGKRGPDGMLHALAYHNVTRQILRGEPRPLPGLYGVALIGFLLAPLCFLAQVGIGPALGITLVFLPISILMAIAGIGLLRSVGEQIRAWDAVTAHDL